MIYMQKCQLDILFSQNEEETITKFDTFGEIEPPNRICNLSLCRKETEIETYVSGCVCVCVWV